MTTRALYVYGPSEQDEVVLDLVSPVPLELLQTLVGGWIECVSRNAWTVVCNEEGRLNGLQPTRRWMTGAPGTYLMVGSLVVLGAVDDEGEHTGLTADGERDYRRTFVPLKKEGQK